MIALVALFSLFTLALCGGVSESMADDINLAAEKEVPVLVVTFVGGKSK